MLLTFLTTVAAFAASAVAASIPHMNKVRAIPAPHVVHEKRNIQPKLWTRVKRSAGGIVIPVRIGLTQSNLDRGEELLLDVSHHESTNYGKHYTPEEIIDLFAPSTTALDAVRSWLYDAGVQNVSLSTNKQWMQFDTAIENLEALLKTEYHDYEHTESGLVHLACDQYHVPAHIQEHIDFVKPGISLMITHEAHADATKRKRAEETEKHRFGPRIVNDKPDISRLDQARGGSLDACDYAITPDCLRTMYNISMGSTQVKGNQLGIFEYAQQYYLQESLNAAWATVSPYIPTGTEPICKGIDGGVCENAGYWDGLEAELDLQVVMPLIWPQKAIMFSTDDPPTQAKEYYYGAYYYGFLNNFWDGIDGSYCSYSAFGLTGNSPGLDPEYPNNATGGWNKPLQCGVYRPTNVISISYGIPEAYPELPLAYQKRQCNEILKLGLQGTSVVVSSGDSGVGTFAGCIGDAYYGYTYVPGSIFWPNFPASCPYVTSVGSTVLPLGAKPGKDKEIATTSFPSGGGFSNIWAAQSYQKPAIDHFFDFFPPDIPYYETTNNETIGGPFYGSYNRIGRGIPDVAANGDNFLTWYFGNPTLVGGTSESAPIFASILTLINEQRLLAGKSTVGFVNPALYAHPNMFRDITVGNNYYCGYDGDLGFDAQPGWDPVTGLGTPKFNKMMDVFMKLP